ncbi:erythromycin esterase family protein [Pseudonocardia sp. MH-G8]|uniref:erythromycin esterase family protein n=1 Tax=Pseudonocardia sp. MH-G8 TaxID=1854588 RepID=UPI000BA0AD95|nr:erythromycin esterase family protein [Pseudonocardia sp. MH-G8]OZM75897.1 erythromycin esterase [Pseudonocardia sp. MH-G8]
MATTTPPPARLSGDAVRPLATLDPAAPTDDLAWLDDAIGDARVVAIGESAHFNREFALLRHRVLRHLVERHGFSAYAMESGFVEGWQTDAWVRGGADGDRLDDALANGITSLMGLNRQMRAHLEWMRQHNRTGRPVGFYGIDVPGSTVSPLPGLDAVRAHFAVADPGFVLDPALRDTAAAYAGPSTFAAGAAVAAYRALAPERRDALTSGLADLAARMRAHRFDHLQRTTVEEYERALHSLHLTVGLDAMHRELARGSVDGTMSSIRDAAIADTVEWILRREGRLVVAAHNGHVQRHPVAVPGMLPTATTMGMHLAERLGEDYLVIGTTSGTGETLNIGGDFYTGRFFTDLDPPGAGTLDALMAASHDGPFAVDLRRLSPADAGAVAAAPRHRMGALDGDVRPLDAFDLVVHLPHVTAADPDPAALAHAPADVQAAFARWMSSGVHPPQPA